MNILIVNQPLNNRGDESAHRGLVGTLLAEIPGARLRVLFQGANQDSIDQYSVRHEHVEYVNEAYSSDFIWRLSRSHWRKTSSTALCRFHPNFRRVIRHYHWADIIVCAPGGICMGGFQDWGHLFFLAMAECTHKPLAYYGRSFGPFPEHTKKQRRFKAVSERMLHYFGYLSIRDGKTEQLARSMEIPYVRTVDSAFLELPRVDIPAAVSEAIGAVAYFVFVPNLLIWHPAYKGKLSKADIVDFYSRMLGTVFQRFPDFKAVMLPQTFNFGNREDNDVNLFRDIKANMNDERIVVIDDTCSSDLQQTVIAGARFLIGARYHSVVFSLNNAVPFIALNYEHKIAGLLETLGKTDRMVDIEQGLFTAEGRDAILDAVEHKLADLQPDEAARDEAKDIAHAAFDRFKEWVGKLG